MQARELRQEKEDNKTGNPIYIKLKRTREGEEEILILKKACIKCILYIISIIYNL